MPREFVPPSECPVCGEAVPRDVKACPGCGADERSGWNDEATRYDGLDLPDESFVGEELGQARRKPGKERLWWSVALVLLALVVCTFVFRG